MKKLLLLLFFIPNLVMAEFNADAARADGVSEEDIQAILTYEKHEKAWRLECARQSGKANNEFSAKKIYKTCLDDVGVKDK